ncbi:PIR protein [Plasmodium ovale]|uniref:PIR protein n=1 Tax=Plasmodium ovale TaxID=36330 RepID=A0A1D3JEF9_PLAOA|nr:PIR protein [Plasmodium ovale]
MGRERTRPRPRPRPRTRTKSRSQVDCSEPLPSVKFYEKLKCDESSLEKCRNYNDFKYPIYKNNQNFIDLCAKVVKFLQDRNLKVKKKKRNCNHCVLLSYWILDQIDSLYSGQSTNKLMAFTNIQLIWNAIVNDPKYAKENICQPDSHIILDHIWKVKKVFYDYLENYKVINAKSKSGDFQCKQYENYFTENLLKYTNSDKTSLDAKLKKYLKTYKNNENCLQTFDLSEIIDNEKVVAIQKPEQSAEEQSFIGKIQSFITGAGGLQQLMSPKMLMVLIENIRGSDNSPSKSLYTRIITIVCSILGILFLVYFWYKFTPYGAVPRLIVRKIQKFRYKRRQKKAKKLLEEKSESEEKDSHHVSYAAE